MNWKNILTRAGWAALAAFAGAFTVPAVVTDLEAWKVVGIAAASAGVAAFVSAVKTIIVEATTGTTSITVNKEV